MKLQDCKEDMNIVIVGHVDHGKSTIIGRLLADTDSLPTGKLEQVKETCKKNSKPFEYAFLLDALKDEQAQGITIDSARCFFKTAKRNYVIIDAPGHTEFLKNMVTGAARAEAALLVIDASEGVKENTRRHGYMLSLLGVKQVVILINKMDLVNYDQKVFEEIKSEATEFLQNLNLFPRYVIPVSGRMGDNIASVSREMPWYADGTVLASLDQFKVEKSREDKPFRMPVQDVYKFTNFADNRRIVAGNVESGKLLVGDRIVFYPSGKRGTVKTIESFNAPEREFISAGFAAGLTLEEAIFVKRGEIATREGELAPQVDSRIKANIFWLGKEPFRPDQPYVLKLGTMKVKCSLAKIIQVIDSLSLEVQKKHQVELLDVAECVLQLEENIAYDFISDVPYTGRFVIVDNYEIVGGGIIQAPAGPAVKRRTLFSLLKKFIFFREEDVMARYVRD